MEKIYYLPSHEYIKVDGNEGYVGISEYAAAQLGVVTYVDAPEEGDEFEAGEEFGAIESRKAAGLTQKQLAEKMGPAQSNISRFENGNSNPSLEFLQKMAACMGKTLHVSFE